MRTLVLDMDGTICKIKENETYSEVPQRKDVVAKIKELKKQGNNITIYSARNMRTYNGNLEEIERNTRPIMEEWLSKRHIPYDNLVLGKVWAKDRGYYVDDRAMTPEEFVKWVPSTLIIPLGGKSSRHRGLKYMSEVDGTTMLQQVLESLPLRFFDCVIFGIVEQHEKQYHVIREIKKFTRGKGIHTLFYVFNDFTSSQSETVATLIKRFDVKGQITIKDCDNRINVPQFPQGNSVCGYELRYGDSLEHHRNKSFIVHENGRVKEIAEKNPISATIVCGAYTFSDAEQFVRYYDKMNVEGECYISLIIRKMMEDGITFDYIQSPIFDDWGTQEDLDRYRGSENGVHISDSVL